MKLLIFFCALLLAGCQKTPRPECSTAFKEGTIVGLSGPDSVQLQAQYALTLAVDAGDRCVSDVQISVVPVSDSVQYLTAQVRYNSPPAADCSCKIAPLHYVRLYFSALSRGTLLLMPPPAIGPGSPADTGYRVTVY